MQTINIDGITYEFDPQELVKSKLLQKVNVYSVGDYFRDTEDPEHIYVVTAISHNQFILTDITSGRRYCDPVQVDKINAITEKEWAVIGAGPSLQRVEVTIRAKAKKNGT